MSYTSQPTNNQSLNGIISITDGILTIENGEISNIGSLDVKGDSLFEGSIEVIGTITGDVDINAKTFTSSGFSNFYKNNTVHTNTTTQNINKIKCNQIVSNNATLKNTILTNVSLTKQTTPTSSGATGISGQIVYDDNYIYIYTSQGWKRAELFLF